MTKFLNNADIKGYIAQTAVTSYLLKADSTGRLVAAIAGTDYQAPTTALLPSGGTAGQILAKIDGTNYNTQWIDNFAQQIKYDVKLGAALSKGTPVYVSSANGTNIIVSASSNATEATSSKTLGLLETGGALNDIVKVVSDGLLSGLNTSAATIGDPVWLGVNGALIFGLANKPSAPAHLVYIGAVTRVHATNGEIFIKVQNGFELDELHNVALSSIADGQGLFYESATSLWKNKTIASVLGYTPANGANYLPLSGGTISGDLTISSTNPRLYFTDTDNNPDYFISNTDGTFTVYDVTNSVGRFKIYSGGNAEFTGSVTTNSTFNITNGLTLFGNHISTQWYNGVDGVFVNYVGYNGGTTQFRNFYVYDGKQGVIATFDGSAKSFTLSGNLSVNNGANTAVSLNGSAFVGVEYSRASNIFGYVGTENSASGGMRYNSVNGNYEHTFYTNSVSSFKLLSTRQVQFTAYTTSTSFSGTAAGYLAFDSSGNVITVAGVAATDNTKLPLAGGTMTGALVVSAADRGFEVNASGGISLYSNEINAGALGGTGTIYLGWRRTSQINVGVPISSNSTIAATGAISTTVAASAWGFLATTSGYSNGSGIWFSSNVGELLLRKADGTLSTRISADGTYAFINNNNIIHAGNIGSQSVTYATNSTRLYASDSPYTYGGAAPYYLYMNYDGGSYWELKVSPATPGTVRVAYANSAGSASSASTSSQVTINYNNDSNSTYQLLWGSGNNVYGTSQVYVNPSSDVIYARGGYISPGNPWGTSDSAFFPNGITTAGSNNWIYGNTYLGNAPANGAGHQFFTSGSSYSTGDMEAGGSMRAPIFYDRNDTGYYMDFNSTTSGVLRGNLIFNDYGAGIVGSYASTRYQAVFSMGNAYKLPIDGTSTGSLYGLAWSHPNAGGIAGNLNTHGLLVMENGTFLAAISGNIKARDGIIAGSYMYAPSYLETNGPVYATIMYDNNDRSYYVDPNSMSQMSGIMSNNWFRPQGDTGLYSQDYGGYFRRNTNSYGTWESTGYAKNGWGGYVNNNNYIVSWMLNTSGDFGFLTQNGNWWNLFYNNGNNCWGIGTDNTYSGDGFRCIKYGSSQYGWTTWSDRRAKENISNITGALDKVLNMRGVYFNYISDEAKNKRVGFIAQELEGVLPEAVRYAEEIDEYNVEYAQIVSVLAEAIKEQNAKIQTLEDQLQTLLN